MLLYYYELLTFIEIMCAHCFTDDCVIRIGRWIGQRFQLSGKFLVQLSRPLHQFSQNGLCDKKQNRKLIFLLKTHLEFICVRTNSYVLRKSPSTASSVMTTVPPVRKKIIPCY